MFHHFKRFSVGKNCLRPLSTPLNKKNVQTFRNQTLKIRGSETLSSKSLTLFQLVVANTDAVKVIAKFSFTNKIKSKFKNQNI